MAKDLHAALQERAKRLEQHIAMLEESVTFTKGQLFEIQELEAQLDKLVAEEPPPAAEEAEAPPLGDDELCRADNA